MIFVDLDKTLVDTKKILDLAGPEPVVGTDEHTKWVAQVTAHDALRSARAVQPILDLVVTAHGSMNQIAFVTSREEDLREVTEGWLARFGLSQIPLLMRENGDKRPSGVMKESVIKVALRCLHQDQALVIDDDDNGTVQAACLRNGWVFLKAIY